MRAVSYTHLDRRFACLAVLWVIQFLPQHLIEARQRHRFEIHIALDDIAAGSLQELHLFRRFHPFRNRFHLQLMRHRQNIADDDPFAADRCV